MRRFLSFIICAFAFSCCGDDTAVDTSIAYFSKGDFSRDVHVDSICNALYSATLQSLNEDPLKNHVDNNTSYRLTVVPFVYNPYCIRVDNADTVTTITFKVAGDKMDFARSGLTHLDLTYDSKHPRMDSVFHALNTSIIAYDFYPGFGEADFVAADGTTYVLESWNDGRHRVVLGWNAGDYKGKGDLLLIVDKMHSFLPNGLLPNLENIKSFEDLLFPVFKRDSLRE
jgi:hypothetical protein